MLKISRPILKDAPSHCAYYFNLPAEENLFDAFESSKRLTAELIKTIPSSFEEYKYAPGKWTLKMVLSHVIDTERLYCFNAMLFSRKDKVVFADYNNCHICALNANTNQRGMNEIFEEYLAVREATIKLFSYMTDDMLDHKNSRDEFVYTPRSLGWMIAGHNIHHCNVIKDKYLSKVISD